MFGPSGTLTVLEGLIVGSRTARIEVEVSNELVLNKLQGERYGPPGVAFVNRDVAASIMESQKLDKVRWAGNGPPVDLVLGFSRANVSAEISEAFDKAIAEMKESGQLKEIFLRHKLGENIPE